MFLELYKFIFRDFYTFVGTVVLILTVRGILTNAFWSAIGLLKETTPKKNK